MELYAKYQKHDRVVCKRENTKDASFSFPNLVARNVFTPAGANMSIKDNKNRNFLHLAILNGAKLQHFGEDLFKVSQTLCV